MHLGSLVISKSTDTSVIEEQILDGQEFLIKGSDFWSQFTHDQIYKFMNDEALYVLPTEELIDYLDELIGDKTAIEIGAGRGFIGRELNIHTTDSYQQLCSKKIVKIYDSIGCPRVKYGKWVEKADAISAVRKYRPHTVPGCFVTHKWRYDTMSGNDEGIDMTKLLSLVKRFILVGNKVVHKDNPLMKIPHQEIMLPGLITKGIHQEEDRIFIWEKNDSRTYRK